MSKFLRRLRNVFFPAAASVLMLAGGCDMPQEQQKGPQAAQTEEPVYLDSLDIFEDTVGIGALRADFARTQQGRDILAFLDDHGAAIVYNKPYCERHGANALYGILTHKIRVHPERPMSTKIMAVFHEAKHAYNDVVLGTSRARQSFLSPQDKWAMFQMDEADAFSFSAYCLAVRQVEGVDSITPAPTLLIDKVSRALRLEIAGDGLSLEEYKRIALDPFVKRVNMMGYTDQSGGHAKEMAGRADTPEKKRKALALTPDAAAFEALMTGFGGMEMDPAAQTVFKDAGMSAEDIVYRYIFLGINKETRQNLDSFFVAENAANAKTIASIPNIQSVGP